MNALLQHRGHVLLSAGHSIAGQNFNEQLHILLMLAVFSLMLWLNLPINIIIIIFGVVVSALMLVFMFLNRLNLRANPGLGNRSAGRTVGEGGVVTVKYRGSQAM